MSVLKILHLGGRISGSVTLNRAEFSGSGSSQGSNTFNELLLLSNKTYSLQSGMAQTVKTNLTLAGRPCDVLPIQSSAAGTRANLNVMAGNTLFNFVNMKDINASGLPLHFMAQSTIANQNNNNVTFGPNDGSAMERLGTDRLCYTIDDSNPASYTLDIRGKN